MFNGEEFLLPGGISTASICYNEWIINATPPYYYYNDAYSQNMFVETLDLEQWQ